MDDCIFHFETERLDSHNRHSYYFREPLFVLSLNDPSELNSFFSRLEDLRRRYYLAGFLTYDLGLLFEPDYFSISGEARDIPYALFGVYDKPSIYDNLTGRFVLGEELFLDRDSSKYKLSNFRRNVSGYEYRENLLKIKEAIYRGDIYQVNYTMKYHFDFSGSSFSLYNFLKSRQSVSYNVFAKFSDYSIISISPELFFSMSGDNIRMKPMKGTLRRGHSFSEDLECSDILFNDEKNRSENVMIVDLLRNDLGIISKWSSVEVTNLFEIERYNSLYQMTSTIESSLRSGLSFYDIVRALFPSGSITGAPKLSSMAYIDLLEKGSRGIYTGALGFLSPFSKVSFNVAIRTLLIRGSSGEFGVGGGIVYDSDVDEEEAECFLKFSFLREASFPSFSLIETFKFIANDYEDLDLHLSRLFFSASYFGFSYNEVFLRDLFNINRFLYSSIGMDYRVRILLHRDGRVDITFTHLLSLFSRYILCISDKRVSSDNIFLHHKTTNRSFYDEELEAARERGYFDLIFFNERDELTECAISNIYLKFGSSLYTPPLSCGLLAGVIRNKLLLSGEVEERVLSRDDLLSADRVYISNSIIGFVEVTVSRSTCICDTLD